VYGHLAGPYCAVPTTALPDDLRAERERIDVHLEGYLDTALARVTDLHPSLEVAAEELRAFVLGGGKRLRPLFMVTGFVGARGGSSGAVLGAALALELLHTCALLHDDVIDASPTRRGRPTAHERFATYHAEHAYHGDAQAFGRAVAILLGDLAFVQADDALLGCAVPGDRLLAALRVFTTLREEVTAGQYLDTVAAHGHETSSELALEVASLKSGRYTVARPLQLGATLAGDDALAGALFEVGLPLGVAFQLRDDVLGVFGNQAATGKPTASDLAEGKRTLLVTETLRRLGPADREVFTAHLGDADLDVHGQATLRRLMTSSGGRAAVEQRIGALTDEARRRAGALDLAAPADAWLDALVELIVTRSS